MSPALTRTNVKRTWSGDRSIATGESPGVEPEGEDRAERLDRRPHSVRRVVGRDHQHATTAGGAHRLRSQRAARERPADDLVYQRRRTGCLAILFLNG